MVSKPNAETLEKPTITLKIVDVHEPEVPADKFLNDKLFITEEETSKSKDSGISNYRDWLPDVNGNIEEIKTINKLPHQRSKV